MIYLTDHGASATCSITSSADIIYIIITRVSEVIMFSPSVFVCLSVSLSRCLSGRFNYEGLVPHKQYFAGTLFGTSSCASYGSRTHDVIDDVTRSQILKLIYLRQYLSYSVDQMLKMSEMLMAIFLVYSISGITSGKKKFVASSKWRPFWNIKYSFNLTPDVKRSSKIIPKEYFSWWWRHRLRHRAASNSALYITL